MPEKPRRIVVAANPHKAGIGAALAELSAWAGPRGIELCVARDLDAESSSSEQEGQACDPMRNAALGAVRDLTELGPCATAEDEPALLLSLGGDGTMLHAIHRLWPMHAPVMGVNLGSLGFNASVLPGQMTAMLERWSRGEAQTEERMLLRVRRTRAGEMLAQMIAVNDVVLVKQAEAHVIHVTLSQGGETVTSYAGDGLIVATPTGSTAYNLSVGGPIMHPSLRVVVASAICPHTLASRPVVLAPQPAIELGFVQRHAGDRVILWIDGQQPWPLDPQDRVTIEAEGAPLRLIMGEGHHYFDQLRQKLLWNVENRPFAPPSGAENRADHREQKGGERT